MSGAAPIGPPWLAGVLSRLYEALVAMRNRRFERAGAASVATVPVVSVGNLTVGGTGKTPFVAWLVRRLADEGLRPAVVSRGYRGRAGRGPLLVSRGEGALHDAALCGDEPHWLANAVPGAIVVVGSDRVAGAAAAHEQGAQVVVLDDGFQHRRLARDLDIVLLDCGSPLGNGRLLPAGPLREPPENLARADLLVLTRCDRDEEPAGAAIVRRHNDRAPLFLAAHRAVGFVDRNGGSCTRPSRAVGFCGIGDPDSFLEGLLEQGVEVVGFRPFRDHHRYTASEIDELRRLAREREAALVTTEKDLSRLDDGGTTGKQRPIIALRIELDPFDADGLFAIVQRAIRRRAS